MDMVAIMQQARQAIESMYTDKCDIIERQERTDPITKKTSFQEVTVISEQPCKLSFGSVPVTSNGDAAEMVQTVKLFISPDISIKPGSKIVVTKPEQLPVAYSNSGKPATFTNHQEITLELFERWS